MSRRKTSDVLGELAAAGAPVPQQDVKTARQHDGKPVKLTVYVADEVAKALTRAWAEGRLAGGNTSKSAIVEAALRAALGM